LSAAEFDCAALLPRQFDTGQWIPANLQGLASIVAGFQVQQPDKFFLTADSYNISKIFVVSLNCEAQAIAL
jgi:hypothetical protein